jgi:hypothetical protein
VNLRSAFILTILISVLASCTKIESTDIGSGLIPPIDNVNTFEQLLDVHTFNQYNGDSVYPTKGENLVLGRVSNDPLFGKTTGIINMEVKPDFFPYRFNGIRTTRILDSMVLVLGYKGVWGDSATKQTLNVYELTQNQSNWLDPNKIYSTKNRFQHSGPAIGTTVVDPKNMLVDSIKPNKEPVNKNQIRIRITDASVMNRLFYDTVNHEKDTALKQAFAGFAIVPDTSSTTPNNLLVVNLADTNTKVAFYYSYLTDGATKRDTTVAYWKVGARAGFSNNVIRNPSGPVPEFVASVSSHPAEDSLVYLQTRPDAPFTKIKIPGLDTLSNKIIHRAELQIVQVPDLTTNPSDLDRLFSPPLLFVTAYSNDSSRRFMLPGGDVQFSLQGVSNYQDFGSYPFNRTINNRQVVNYAFDITRYVQGIATKKNRNHDLSLFAPYAEFVHAAESFNSQVPLGGSGTVNPLALGRVRVGGGSLSKVGPNAPYRMRIRIIYTRI